MTNWMTAAGIALIAGGLAILIGFRHVLLSRSEARPVGERRHPRKVIETPPAPEPVVVPEQRDAPDEPDEPEDEEGGLARIGLAAEEPPAPADRDGDRISGWVRPEPEPEGDDEPVSGEGEYWTPVPESTYADAAYGWPVPVERMPAAPLYPPQSGFDPDVEAEPTGVMPTWPPAAPSDRFEVPQSWATRNTKDARKAAEPRSRQDRRSTVMIPAIGDADTAPRRRPRPRPGPDGDHSTVYRSRHAADPS